MNKPIKGALVKWTAEGSKVLLTLPAKGRALVSRVPPPVQDEIAKLSSRGAHVCREIFAGILVVGLIAIVMGYGRLAQGPISLPTLVPTIETAINEQLSDLHGEDRRRHPAALPPTDPASCSACAISGSSTMTARSWRKRLLRPSA